jgi:hypothetical protein
MGLKFGGCLTARGLLYGLHCIDLMTFVRYRTYVISILQMHTRLTTAFPGSEERLSGYQPPFLRCSW